MELSAKEAIKTRLYRGNESCKRLKYLEHEKLRRKPTGSGERDYHGLIVGSTIDHGPHGPWPPPRPDRGGCWSDSALFVPQPASPGSS